MASKVAFVLGFALLAFLQLSAAQTVHFVGEGAGWMVPQGGAAFYSNWAEGKRFHLGDSLVFNFQTNAHDVQRVNRQSFNECSDNDDIGDTIITGPATVNLTSPGEHYYICTIGRHCQLGQKLAITVSATRGATPPSSNTPRPPATTPPSTTSPSPKGSPDAACAPTPGGSPSSGGGPQVISPPGSSSQAVAAALSVTLLGLVLSFF